jgi:general secretion pathway protein H
MPRFRRQDGFTLIEMIVVLAVLGLMLGLFIGHGPMRSARLDLDAAGREVAASLRLARSLAIARNRSVIWTASPTRYGLTGEALHALPTDVALQGSPRIGFAADGSSSGGALVLRSPNRSVAISVDWLTGRVSLAGG